MKMKLSKAHAERALRAVAGSATGIEVVRDGVEYAVIRGLMGYWIKLEDMWPSVPQIRVTIYFTNKEIKVVYIDQETFKPDWATTEREERRREREDKYNGTSS